ncbi:unannotated protein [freshwater metagenome]|uniref:Unannotated protein n=1 Tax=freshwater metagenome TaxID=449393 RepID=A0A6J6BSG0_9ZZZZ
MERATNGVGANHVFLVILYAFWPAVIVGAGCHASIQKLLNVSGIHSSPVIENAVGDNPTRVKSVGV